MEDNLRYKTEEDKALIYDSLTNRDICMYFNEETRDLLLTLLNTANEKI